jgi:hypothetical protein
MLLGMLDLAGCPCDVDLVCFDVHGLLIVMFAIVGSILIWPPLVERIRPRREGKAISR